MDAAHCTRVVYISFKHFIDHIFMALHAIALKDPRILFLDQDRFLKLLRREGQGVVVPVFSLGDVFADKIVREVAIDAGGNGMVAGLLP